MAELITVARPYARAAFERASAAAALPAWSVFLARAAAVVSDAQVVPLLGNPRVPPQELVEFLLELAAPAAAQPELPARQEQRNFLVLLAHNRRLRLLPQIAQQYEQRRSQAEHIADVEVVAARELTAAQVGMLTTALERRLGCAVRLHARVDAALLGGAVVHYGDFVVDGSLRRRVERLAAEIGGTNAGGGA